MPADQPVPEQPTSPTPPPEGSDERRTTCIVVYCSTCDYFLKTVVAGAIGTHGCTHCHTLMEVYVPQELANPDWTHHA